MEDRHIIDDINIGAPYFEDLERGQKFDAPGITILGSHALLHQALFGDRLRLPLDRHLSHRVTGMRKGLAHPCLVANIAIGQSTEATQRVKANLFYSKFVHKMPVSIGDTIRTSSEVVALRRNRSRESRRPTGMAVLNVSASNHRGDEVLTFQRCAMLPCKENTGKPDRNDNIEDFRTEPEATELLSACPSAWNLTELRRVCPSPVFSEVMVGQRFLIQARDSVTEPSLLVRATLNMARTHLDAAASHLGQCLVYGGHTVSLACAQISRSLPGIATIVGWQSCDHLAPVVEHDVLQTRVRVLEKNPFDSGGGLCALHAETFAIKQNDPDGAITKVLDWRFSALMC